jgi:hypothetical protein
VKNLLHPRGYVGLAPVNATKQDQAWSCRSGKSQQPWIIQIGGNHGSRFLPRAYQDVAIRGAIETHDRGVNGVVSLGREPLRQGRRQRHIDKKFHRANSTVSSSASKAAYCKASLMSSGSR